MSLHMSIQAMVCTQLHLSFMGRLLLSPHLYMGMDALHWYETTRTRVPGFQDAF